MYNQTRSLNLGLALDMGIEAAFIYDDLAYAQNTFGDGYFYRSYESLLNRLPIMSESTMRRAIRRLESDGWISTKVKKVNGTPRLHFHIDRTLSVKSTETIEAVKLTESLLDKTTIKTTKSAEALTLLPSLIALVNKKEKPTDDRRRALTARLKDYTADEITAAAVAFSKSEWHKENKQMSIDNLLAPSKFGRWYEQSTAGKPKHDNGAGAAGTTKTVQQRQQEATDARMRAENAIA